MLLDGTVWDNVGKYKIELVTKGDDTYLQLQLRLLLKLDEMSIWLNYMSYFHHMNGIQIRLFITNSYIGKKISVSVSTIEHNMLEIFKINVKNLTRV
jgi:hypothetical protein